MPLNECEHPPHDGPVAVMSNDDLAEYRLQVVGFIEYLGALLDGLQKAIGKRRVARRALHQELTASGQMPADADRTCDDNYPPAWMAQRRSEATQLNVGIRSYKTTLFNIADEMEARCLERGILPWRGQVHNTRTHRSKYWKAHREKKRAAKLELRRREFVTIPGSAPADGSRSRG